MVYPSNVAIQTLSVGLRPPTSLQGISR